MELQQRKSLRMQNYDYSQRGLYFLTVCTQGRKCLFGTIRDGVLSKNPAGEMIDKWYAKLSENFPNIRCLEHIVMPNHFHCIIQIMEQSVVDISTIMQWFKTMTTNEYIRGVKQLGWPRFEGKLWQRSFYDNIIRSQDLHYIIVDYINSNPSKWDVDKFFSE